MKEYSWIFMNLQIFFKESPARWQKCKIFQKATLLGVLRSKGYWHWERHTEACDQFINLLNKVLRWIRYLIPNKKDLIKRLYKASIFSKFDTKSGFWQIYIEEKDKYTAFMVPFGHYKWNVKPFGFKKCSIRISKYQEQDLHSLY